MFDRQSGQPQTPSSHFRRPGRIDARRARDAHRAARSCVSSGSGRQLRGFDRTEVVAFLTEAADDYEHALREIDRLRQDLLRMEALLSEHRDREANLRNTLLTAQRLADEVKNRGGERSQDDRARGAGAGRPAAAEGAASGSRKSSATSPSCACGAATSKGRWSPRSRRSTTRSSSSASRTSPTTRCCSTVRAQAEASGRSASSHDVASRRATGADERG